ncbi:major capsid protein [Rhizobium phage RHph_I3_11]|nr:major capsid protein [Rhizobium phage RHph_I3_11]
MAFQSATGYNNLPNGKFSPVIYSQKVQKQFRKTSVIQDVTNSDYFGEISNYGDTVQIIKEPEIAISKYARGAQLTSQDLEDQDFTLIVDRANAFQFQIDDIEKKQSHVNWLDLATDRAAYNLAQTYDADILGYLSGYEQLTLGGAWTARTTAVGTKSESGADADELFAIHKLARNAFVSGGSSSDSIAVGTAGTYDVTPLQVVNRMNRLLDQQNVPKEGRWLIVDPVFLEILMDENSKFMNQFYQDSEQLSNGKLSANTVYGFKWYTSNNLPFLGSGPAVLDNNGSSTDYGVIVAGHDSSVATAEQINKTETFRSPFGFSDIVRGMHMYGRKILKPQGLVRAVYNKAN